MPPSRRALLSVATAAATALAGCSGSGATERDSANERPVPDGDGGADPPPYAYLRHDEPAGLAWFEGDDRAGDDRPVHLDRLVVDSRDRAESLTYADVEDAAAVREFVTGTDFETETVLVDQRRVEACYRLELCSVQWSATEVDFDYSRVGLAYDVPCEADAKATEARFLRIPDALDRDSLSSFSSRVGRGGCPDRHDPVAGSDVPGNADANGATTDGRIRAVGSTEGRVR